MTAPRINPIVALSNTWPSASSIGVPRSDVPPPLGRFAPYDIERYAAEYWPGEADRRYVPGGSAVNSNAPCASVVAVFGRPMLALTLPLTTVVTPFTVTVRLMEAPAFPAEGVPLAVVETRTGVIIDRFTVARRIGAPVSAPTTRPRMTPVPVGSGGGFRPGCRGGCMSIRGRGGGGATCGPPARLNANRRGVITTVGLLRQV